MKAELKTMSIRVNKAEEGTSDLEDRIMESPKWGSRQKAKWKKKKNESNIRDLWDNRKVCQIMCNRDSRRKGIESIFEEITAENFPNLKKETDIQIQEAQRAPHKWKPRRPTPKPIIIKMAKVKDKERIQKAAREKQRANYKGTPIKLSEFPYRNTLGQKRVARYIQSSKKEKLAT